MANNYLEYSEVLDDLTDEELDWWQTEYDRIQSGSCTEAEEDDDSICEDFAIDRDQRQVWFHPDESGNAYAVAKTVQLFLKEHRPEDCFYLQWAEFCSKPRVGEFGGGAVFVTAHQIVWHTAEEWLQKMQTEFAGRAKGFPHISLSFQGWSRGVELTECWDLAAGKKVNLAGVTADELASKVNHGVWSIALSDCLGQSTKDEIEITDVTASR